MSPTLYLLLSALLFSVGASTPPSPPSPTTRRGGWCRPPGWAGPSAWSTLRDPHAGDAARGWAEALRSENDHRLAEVFGRCDLLFTPTTPRLPHGHDDPGPT